MKWYVVAIAVVFILLVGTALWVFGFPSLPETTGGISNSLMTVAGIIPVFVIIGVIMAIITALTSLMGDAPSEETDEEEVKPITHVDGRERGERILRERYARGDISTEEYNERMSNI